MKHYIFTRGGVEDTRLETKAKDTKKIRGQGTTFLEQTLSRPRTGMLKAKPRTKDTTRKRSPKKGKVFAQKIEIFSWNFRRRKKVMTLAPFLTNQKTVLSSAEAEHFRGLGGFEAKAKDLKMCPQGQRRPRGLHLRYLHYNVILSFVFF